MKEATRQESSIASIPKKSFASFRAIQGHSGGISIDPELMVYIPIPYNWKEYIFHKGCSCSIQSILENGLIPGGKESDKGRQSVFFTPLSPFGGDSDEEEPNDDYTVPQKMHYHNHWKHDQDAVYWVKNPEHKINDCNSGKRSHMQSSYNRATCQNEDRTLFERLSTPRPAAESHTEKKLSFAAAAANL